VKCFNDILIFGSEDVKTEESFTDDFEAVCEGGDNLFVEAFAHDKAVDDDFDGVVFVFVEFKFFG